MPVTTPPALTNIPDFPALSDRAAGTYNSKAFAFGSHMADTFNAEVAALAGNVFDNATDAADSASSAATQAGNAATQAGNAATSATASNAAKLGSEAALDSALVAAAAAGAAAGFPAMTGKALQNLRVNAGETGVEFALIPPPVAPPGPRNWFVAQYTASAAFTVPAGVTVIRPYAFGAGAAGTTSNSGAGGGCAYGDIAVTPGSSVTLSIASGVSKVTYGGTDLLTANPATGATAGTASKNVSVTNGGAYSGGAGSSAAQAGGASSGSPLGVGVNGDTIGGSGWGGAGPNGNGGGVGGPGDDARGGDGLLFPSADPLLAPLTGRGGGVNGGSGDAGGGGGDGGVGGFGGGGGLCPEAGKGEGGFGGGGGGGAGSVGGNGGFGGGGGRATTTPGAGGTAVIRIYY